MNRFQAETLDLSRLPPFELVRPSYETILAERLASLRARFAAHGIPADHLNLETDPLVILEQEDAYRELLNLTAINDHARSLSLTRAIGPVLDHLAATYYAQIGIRRLEGEDDDRFRRRIVLAPEAASPFTPGAYKYAALTATLDVADAEALNHASGLVDPGEILLVVLGRPGIDETALAEIVRDNLDARPIKALTDTVTVRAASHSVVDVAAVIEVAPGPDPELVVVEASARLAAYAAGRRRIGLRLTRSGIAAALHLPVADNVRLDPSLLTTDPGPAGVAELGEVAISVEVPA
ncbi:baseplate J/gp47 family protein [Brevundimonas sp.]|uniref:baseplate J/gp47 family protein n=1 Tax=Brevundimonas sp. TaxID=1871086 RepID=UPI00286CB4CC|nr:baseplate J/gp47 family protein [Brevundimonas sp.]